MNEIDINAITDILIDNGIFSIKRYENENANMFELLDANNETIEIIEMLKDKED